MFSSLARIRWIPVFFSVVLFWAVASPAPAEVIQHGTEEFCKLSGLVYHDANNDGIRSSTEMLIPDVEITLTGFTLLGDLFELQMTTGGTGTYCFNNVPAGVYSVIETQPEILHTARANAPGTAGGIALSPNEFIEIELEPATFARDYNFGEWGLKAKYMSKRDFILVEPTPVPEPTTFTMLGILFGGVVFSVFLRRRRR